MEPFDTRNIKPGSIKILGNKIKQRRNQFNLSQAQLAKGICTQGLISQIENKNVSVNVDIIYSLCHRLDLNINDVIVNRKTKNKTLDLVESLIWDKQYEDAAELMIQLSVRKLDTRELKCRYHCYQGVIESRLNRNAQAAINHFKEVLLKYNGLSNISLYSTWTHIEIAKSYLMLKDPYQAQQFNELSIGYLKRHRFNDQVDFRPLVNVYLESIHLHQQLMRFEDALVMSETVCNFLLSIDSMYQMGTLNLAMAKSFIADKSHAKAIDHLERAHHFGDYYNDHQLVTTVNELREQMLAK
ncbi:helix-turn-helix transcriptional regulator [Lactobacillaceae bacterium Scapto_B20]